MNSLRLVFDKNDKINNYKVKRCEKIVWCVFCKIGVKVKLLFQMHKILSTFKRILFPIHDFLTRKYRHLAITSKKKSAVC
jgi:hypothetical protein